MKRNTVDTILNDATLKQHLKANQKCQPLVKINKLENPKHKYNEHWMDKEIIEDFHKHKMNYEDTPPLPTAYGTATLTMSSSSYRFCR